LNQAPPPVFAADGVCRVDSQDDARNNPRVKFASSLSYLADQLDALKQLEGHSPVVVWFFPALTAFLIPYAFGVGCSWWRTWWLYNAADRIEELQAQITKAYGAGLDVEKCLTHPIGLLGGVTALEAIRYEDYRTKLYASVQRRKIV